MIRSPMLMTLRCGSGGLTMTSESQNSCVSRGDSRTSLELTKRIPGCSLDSWMFSCLPARVSASALVGISPPLAQITARLQAAPTSTNHMPGSARLSAAQTQMAPVVSGSA